VTVLIEHLLLLISFLELQFFPPIQKYFALLDVCIPASDANTSVWIIYNESLNAVVLTQYHTHFCTGPSSVETVPFGSGATYYSASPYQVPNVVGYYQYTDTTGCSGTPNSGAAYSLDIYGQCYFGTQVTCMGNELMINKYSKTDCSGNFTSTNYMVGSCINGHKAFCAGAFNLPPNYVATINYKGFECGEAISKIQFTIVNVCITNGNESSMSVYDPYNNEVGVYTYTSNNCATDTNISSATNFLKLDSYTLTLSSSLLTAIVPKFLIISNILISLYLLN